MFPPMLLYMRFGEPETARHGLWLPLFLLWLILLPLLALVVVVTVLVDAALFLAGARYHHYTLLLLRTFGVLAALRGTTVRVHSPETIVEIELV